MGRRTLAVTIAEAGRDRGKSYLLTEMSAVQAEKWAMRAFLALAKSGVDLPAGIEHAGMAGIAAVGLHALAGIEFAQAEPLMDEMFRCIRYLPDGRENLARALIDDDTEEVRTRMRLRREVLELHLGFSVTEALSTLATSAPARATAASTPTTSTSPAPSAP